MLRFRHLAAALTLAIAPAIATNATAEAPEGKGVKRTASVITTAEGVDLYYKDWGPRNGPVVVFSHGWPLSSDSWEAQMLFLAENGYRVVAHDRRGHGRSSQP